MEDNNRASKNSNEERAKDLASDQLNSSIEEDHNQRMSDEEDPGRMANKEESKSHESDKGKDPSDAFNLSSFNHDGSYMNSSNLRVD